jgi:hypothetical protein
MDSSIIRKVFFVGGGAAAGASIATALASVVMSIVPPLIPLVGAVAFAAFGLKAERGSEALPTLDI